MAGLVLASRTTNLLVFQFAYGGLVGASGGAFFAPIMAATIGWFDKHRSLAVSLVSVGAGVAPMVITPFASFLIQTHGWRSAMLMIAIGALVILIPASLLIRRAPAAVEAPAPALNADTPAERSPSSACQSAPDKDPYRRPIGTPRIGLSWSGAA